ncbi:MAG TPA: hypothetical protein VMF30_06530, partial [Pirellulales bacterium]|nr:hypothetical protein [Pirellulales bacterium]
MNASPFWPLVWKEYRASRAFWLAMAAMGLVAQGAVAWLHRPTDRNWWLYGIALMISAGFAFGIGGTLFAVEHEERTFAMMRILPLRAKELGGAKLLCALLGLAGLLAVLWLAAGALAGWQALSSREGGLLWGLWGLACLEGLAWGVLCSLVFSSPLRATVAAVAAATITIQAAATLTSRHNLAEIASYSEAIPYRLLLLLLVAAADVWLLPRWLAGRVPQPIEARPPAKSPRRAKTTSAWQGPTPRWTVQMGHLMWQAWREVVGSKWLLIGGAVFSLPLVALAVAICAEFLHVGQSWAQTPVLGGVRFVPFLLLAAPVGVTALIGSLVFRVEARTGARFLAERGVSARLVWVARQLVWGGWLPLLLVAVVALTIVLSIVATPEFSQVVYRNGRNPWVYIGGHEHSVFQLANHSVVLNALVAWAAMFSAFTVAQAVSMVVRRPLLSAVFSIVLGTLAAGWAYLMFAFAIPFWWSALPLGLGCLAATWLRAPAWMLSRADVRSWLLPAAVIVAPCALTAFGIPRYRVDEIPDFQPKWPAVDTSPAAVTDVRATLDLYGQANDLYLAIRHESTDPDKPRLADLLVEASRHPSAWLADAPNASLLMVRPLYEMGHWLLGWAGACQIRGELDRSLDLYLATLRVANHFDQCAGVMYAGSSQNLSLRSLAFERLRSWAAAPHQTAERLREALRRLDKLPPVATSAIDRLHSWYAMAKSSVTDSPMITENGTAGFWIARQLPWE